MLTHYFWNYHYIFHSSIKASWCLYMWSGEETSSVCAVQLASSWLASGPWSGSGAGSGLVLLMLQHFCCRTAGSRAAALRLVLGILGRRVWGGSVASAVVVPRVVSVILMASAPPVSAVWPRVSGAGWSASATLVWWTARSAPVAAAARASASSVTLVVVVPRWRMLLFRLHLIGSLPVSLSELYLDLPSADPLPVQVMKRILCVPNVLKHAAAVKALHWEQTDTHTLHSRSTLASYAETISIIKKQNTNHHHHHHHLISLWETASGECAGWNQHHNYQKKILIEILSVYKSVSTTSGTFMRRKRQENIRCKHIYK